MKKNTLWSSRGNKKLAAEILESYKEGVPPMDLVHNMIETTAIYKPDHEPSGEKDFYDRMHTIDDLGGAIIEIIKKTDKKAAQVLQKNYDKFFATGGW